jgi:hypothetical protein
MPSSSSNSSISDKVSASRVPEASSNSNRWSQPQQQQQQQRVQI